MKTRRASPVLVIGGIIIIIGFLWLISARSQSKSLLEGFFASASGKDSLTPPTMDSLMEGPKIGPEEANTGMKNVLMYVESNPTDTDGFLQFLKDNFFTADSQFKSPMDFKGLSSKWSSQFKSKK
jgi:hypothetical protein